VYQIEDVVFGMERPGPVSRDGFEDSGEEERQIRLNIELMSRMVEDYEWAAVYPVPFSLKAVDALKRALGDKALVVSFEWDGVFWMPPGDRFVDFSVKLFEQPEELHREARTKCNKAKTWIRKMADAGSDFFCLAYDFGFNAGPFISPKHFSEFVAPYLAEVVQTVHDVGRRAILHSDGDLRKLLDQLHGSGLDGYQSVDPQGNMDIKGVREQFPDWILMGNVKSSMMQDAVEEEIRESVRYCMKYGGVGKRYILSTSNCIFPGMPPESYAIMLDEYRQIISAVQNGTEI
jgi:uroporphyrinogen decarboxylase